MKHDPMLTGQPLARSARRRRASGRHRMTARSSMSAAARATSTICRSRADLLHACARAVDRRAWPHRRALTSSAVAAAAGRRRRADGGRRARRERYRPGRTTTIRSSPTGWSNIAGQPIFAVAADSIAIGARAPRGSR